MPVGISSGSSQSGEIATSGAKTTRPLGSTRTGVAVVTAACGEATVTPRDGGGGGALASGGGLVAGRGVGGAAPVEATVAGATPLVVAAGAAGLAAGCGAGACGVQ